MGIRHPMMPRMNKHNRCQWWQQAHTPVEDATGCADCLCAAKGGKTDHGGKLRSNNSNHTTVMNPPPPRAGFGLASDSVLHGSRALIPVVALSDRMRHRRPSILDSDYGIFFLVSHHREITRMRVQS